MKDVRLGKYLISFHIAKGNALSDKYFAEYSQHLKWLCDYILYNELDISNLTLNFHTANPVGRVNMASYWNNFSEYYKDKQ